MRFLLYKDLDLRRVKPTFAKVRAAIEANDFKSPDVKKLHVGNYYRAKLDHSNRLLLQFARYNTEMVCLALEVIENEPMRLVTVPGVGKQLAQRIAESYRERKSVKEVMIAFQEKGVGTARAVRIWRHFGPEAVKVIEEDPYRLAREVRARSPINRRS